MGNMASEINGNLTLCSTACLVWQQENIKAQFLNFCEERKWYYDKLS